MLTQSKVAAKESLAVGDNAITKIIDQSVELLKFHNDASLLQLLF